MERFEILEHKADYKIRVLGRGKEELFLNAMLGMEDGLQPEIRSAKSEIRNIKITSNDLNALLVDFLSEVLYLTQANKEVYDDIKFIKFSDIELEAKLSGQAVESFGEDIKAVTYHDLDIQQKAGIWQAAILFDI